LYRSLSDRLSSLDSVTLFHGRAFNGGTCVPCAPRPGGQRRRHNRAGGTARGCCARPTSEPSPRANGRDFPPLPSHIDRVE
jgi:hypothetical protein